MPSSTTWLLLFSFVASLLVDQTEAAQTYPSKNQNVTIQRLNNLMTNFPSFSQFQAILNNVSANIYNNATWTTIKNDAINKIEEVLTTSQYSTLLTKVSVLTAKMGSSAVTSALNKAITVMSNNLSPFFAQMQNYVAYLKNRGLKEQGVVKNGYRITNTFCSKKRIKTIFTRVSLQFSTSDWNSIVTTLGDEVLQFSKNGF